MQGWNAFIQISPTSSVEYNATFTQNGTAWIPSSYYMDYISPSTNYTEDLRFDTFLATSPELALFADFNMSDYTHPQTCPAKTTAGEVGTPANLNVTMYIFHPAANFDIHGQDLGNVAGDVFFTCLDALTNAPSTMDHVRALLCSALPCSAV